MTKILNVTPLENGGFASYAMIKQGDEATFVVSEPWLDLVHERAFALAFEGEDVKIGDFIALLNGAFVAQLLLDDGCIILSVDEVACQAMDSNEALSLHQKWLEFDYRWYPLDQFNN